MPTSVPPRNRRGAVYSTPPSPASSDDEGAGKSSASSFVSPSYHPSFRSFHRGGQEEDSVLASRGGGSHPRSRRQSENDLKVNVLPVEDNLSPWEEWFLCKEREIRARLQARAIQDMNQQLEKRKEIQERERKKIIAEEKHREWVLKKNEEEKERQREAELQEKKEKSERMFKEWLQNSKNKPRPPSTSHAYGNADGNVYPIPAFCNPIPWKPIHVPPPKEEKVSTQVRLFGDKE
uniref:Coiled-coil domain containing 34 n=1 Tax=Salvator merianae TaxID=96440 RepID=A0A8D0DGI9_SALMN